jgi:O-antigen/teichoic acid export membrane protein
VFTLLQGVILGSRAYVLQATTDVTYSIAKLVGTVALVSSGLAVLGAVLGSISASVVGATMAFALIMGNFRGRKLVGDTPGGSVHTTADAVRGSIVPAVLVLSMSLALSADLWIVKAMLPAADAGFYRAAGLFAHVPITLSSGIVWGMYSAYSDAHRREDTHRMRHYVAQVTRLLIAAGGLWIAVVVPTSSALLSFVFSAEYAAGGTVLAILGVGTGIGMLGLAMAPLLLIEGHARGVLIGALSLLGVELAVALVLTPRLGSTGTALAVTAVHVIGTALAVGAMRWRLSLPLGSTLLRLLVPAAVIGAVAWTIHPAANAWLLGWYALFALSYAGLLFVTGGITRADIDAVREGLLA